MPSCDQLRFHPVYNLYIHQKSCLFLHKDSYDASLGLASGPKPCEGNNAIQLQVVFRIRMKRCDKLFYRVKTKQWQ